MALANNPINNLSIMCFCPTITLFISRLSKSIKALSLSIFSLIALMSRAAVVSSIITVSFVGKN
jgi:hypothetical protein